MFRANPTTHLVLHIWHVILRLRRGQSVCTVMRGEKESRRERRAVTGKEHGDKREASSRLGRRMEKCCFYLAFDWNRIERREDSENPRQKDFALAAIKLKNATVIQLRELRTHRRRDWCRLRFLIREQNGGLTTANDCGPEQRKTRNYPERGREGEREREVGTSWTRIYDEHRTKGEGAVHTRERSRPRGYASIWGRRTSTSSWPPNFRSFL